MREQVELRTCIERVTWKLIIPYVKQTANGNLLNDSGNSNQGSVTTERGEMERLKREETCVHVRLLDRKSVV